VTVGDETRAPADGCCVQIQSSWLVFTSILRLNESLFNWNDVGRGPLLDEGPSSFVDRPPIARRSTPAG
jgi:hypothetical protein